MGRIRQIGLAQNPCTDGVVDVVVHVRNAIGGAHDAALAGFGLQVARMVQDAVAHFGRQIQAGATVLDALHHAHRLLVVAIERRGLGRVLVGLCLGKERIHDLVRARHAASAASPVCPKGVCPKSWPSEMASVRSSFSPSARVMVRAICATSNVCVSRVRK